VAKLFFQVPASKPNMQTPLTQICNWVKATPAAPWSAIVMQATNKAIAVQVTSTEEVKNNLQTLLTAAVKYADANWSSMNQTCITELAEAFPNPMDPTCLQWLDAENG